MIQYLSAFAILFTTTQAFAQTVTVHEVTSEYQAAGLLEESTAHFAPATSADGEPTQVDIDQLIALGEKVWDFIVTHQPKAEYEKFQTSIVPAGITQWTMLKGWSLPISKVYRVEFKNILGAVAGSFDYRITFFYGGSYQGKGKFLGQISVIPANIQIGTDRSFKMKVEVASITNFGTENDPIAGAQLMISWTSPTTTRYQMNSAEYFITGSGEFIDLTNGN